MTPAAFNALVGATKLDKKGATVKALRLHLVGGMSIAAAATKARIARQGVYDALDKLPRKRCKTCGQWLRP